MGEEKKIKKFYYYDEDNDLTEYIEGSKGSVASWINPYLTLLFPHDCTELVPKNIIGFRIHEMRHLLRKAEEQSKIPLTPKQEAEIDKMFKEAGWKPKAEVEKENEKRKEDSKRKRK